MLVGRDTSQVCLRYSEPMSLAPTFSPLTYTQFQPPSQSGTPTQMFLTGRNLTSNPYASGQVVQTQSDTANSITGGMDATLDLTEKGFRFGDGVAGSFNAGAELLHQGVSKAGRFAGAFGPVLGGVAEVASLPGAWEDTKKAWSEAGATGNYAAATGETAGFFSAATSALKVGLEVPEAIVKGQARSQATKAFRQAAPNASKHVVTAAARVAADEALKSRYSAQRAQNSVKEVIEKRVRKHHSSVAQAAGVQGRGPARAALREGGKGAARAASQAVTRSAIGGIAKAGARFVPLANIGIAALDSATAAAAWADPNASLGKRINSSITAAGSCVAATNIPVVAQVGAAVSAVSSFVGCFTN